MTKGRNNFATRFPGTKPTFICDMCGKRTRDTGDNGGVGLCPVCYKECEDENVHSDFHSREHPAADCKICKEEGWIK